MAEPAPTVTLRFGFPDDAAAIARLAELDSGSPPAPPTLVAEVAGELRVALSLWDGTWVGDPFHRCDPLVELLRARAEQLRGGPRRRRLFLQRRPAQAGVDLL